MKSAALPQLFWSMKLVGGATVKRAIVMRLFGP